MMTIKLGPTSIVSLIGYLVHTARTKFHRLLLYTVEVLITFQNHSFDILIRTQSSEYLPSSSTLSLSRYSVLWSYSLPAFFAEHLEKTHSGTQNGQ